MGVEASVKAVIKGLPALAKRSPLAESVLLLARLLDSDPSARDAVGLNREFRLTLDALQRLAPEGGDPDVNGFLGRVSRTDLGDAAD